MKDNILIKIRLHSHKIRRKIFVIILEVIKFALCVTKFLKNFCRQKSTLIIITRFNFNCFMFICIYMCVCVYIYIYIYIYIEREREREREREIEENSRLKMHVQVE